MHSGLAGTGDSAPSYRTFGSSGGSRDVEELGETEERGKVVLRVHLSSDSTLNLNLTEPLVETLASMKSVENCQRAEVDEGEEIFSSHWVRNETGLPVFCNAPSGTGYREQDGRGEEELAIPLLVGVGEEKPLPIPRVRCYSCGVSDAGGNTGVSTYGSRASTPVAGLGWDEEIERAPTPGGVIDDIPSSIHEGSVRGSITASRRQSIASTLGGFGSETARRRARRTVLLEFEDGGKAVTERRTIWRSLRPVDANVLGQRIATVVDMAVVSAAVDETHRGRWRPGGWPSRGVDAARGTRTMKIVTEVEYHHGVKVRVFCEVK